jgi:nitroreductase
MNRRKFLGLGASALALGAGAGYLLSDRRNFVRSDADPNEPSAALQPDEKAILSLASLAPSGHNTQPWFVQYLEPFHWLIGNDRSRWLPAVDPKQRETILSIGAFVQTLEFAAASLGYSCSWELLARSNQDESVLRVRLKQDGSSGAFDAAKIGRRRTVRAPFETDVLKKQDVDELTDSGNFIHYLPATSKEAQYLNEQTIEANRAQAYRDEAQEELANWIRFSSKDAAQHRDGLTTASMEIEGIAAWYVRNFYNKESVMTADFRDRGVDNVIRGVAGSAGWLLITSRNDATETLLETGRRMQRLFLKVREKSIGIQPMTQILEESATKQELNSAIGISEPVQFILRTGYIKDYPEPVSLRRPVDAFVRTQTK